MADTRKYEPTTGDPIGDAVRAAMGATIRPNVPGSKPTAPAAAVTPPSTILPNMVLPNATLGAFTFKASLTTPPAEPADGTSGI